MNTVLLSGRIVGNPRIHESRETGLVVFFFDLMVDDGMDSPCVSVSYEVMPSCHEDQSDCPVLSNGSHIMIEGALQSYPFRVFGTGERHRVLYVNVSKLQFFDADTREAVDIDFSQHHLEPYRHLEVKPAKPIPIEPANCETCRQSMLRVCKDGSWYYTCRKCNVILDENRETVNETWENLMYGKGEMYV